MIVSILEILLFDVNVVDGDVSGTSVINGSFVSFLCIAFGIPQPELMWKKNGELTDLPISSVPLPTYYIEEQLTLGNVGPEDGGEYSCVASNEGGTDSASIQLHILGTCTYMYMALHYDDVKYCMEDFP